MRSPSGRNSRPSNQDLEERKDATKRAFKEAERRITQDRGVFTWRTARQSVSHTTQVYSGMLRFESLQDFINGPQFHTVVFLIIILNSVAIGWEASVEMSLHLADYDARELGETTSLSRPYWFQVADIFFNSAFIIELALRVLVQKADF